MRKKLICLFSVLLLCFCLSYKIEAEDEYTYTITVSGGRYGKVNDKDSDTRTYKYNERCNLTEDFEITVTNDKYEFLDFYHISGHYDASALDFPVTEDLVIVAGYSVEGSATTFRVYFVDADGNSMAGKTSGNEEPIPEYLDVRRAVGTEAVYSPPYIDGYWPAAYNYRVGKNVSSINVVYRPNSELPGGGTTIIYDDTVIYDDGPVGGGTGGGGTAPSPAAPVGPVEEIVIDEPDVPQTQPEPVNQGGNGGNQEPTIIEPEPVPTTSFWQNLLNNPWLMIGSLGGLALLIFFLFLLFRRKRDDAQ